LIFNEVHGVIAQKKELFITVAGEGQQKIYGTELKQFR
jgi:hypothetical protein